MQTNQQATPKSVSFRELLDRLNAKLEGPPETLLGNDEAAIVCGVTGDTMKNSRHLGKLAGVKAPGFLKLGRSVFYRLGTLVEWKEQFSEQTCTRTGGAA